MKYKVGDKVKVRQWDSLVEEYGTPYGNIEKDFDSAVFVFLMGEHCGEELEIREVRGDSYYCKSNTWEWQDWMFEKDSQLLLENIESRISYRYLMLGDKGYEFPNSYEGDLIKLMNEYIEALRNGR